MPGIVAVHRGALCGQLKIPATSAMDIGGISGRAGQADSWLRANSARFDFRNLPGQFWHCDFGG